MQCELLGIWDQTGDRSSNERLNRKIVFIENVYIFNGRYIWLSFH